MNSRSFKLLLEHCRLTTAVFLDDVFLDDVFLGDVYLDDVYLGDVYLGAGLTLITFSVKRLTMKPSSFFSSTVSVPTQSISSG